MFILCLAIFETLFSIYLRWLLQVKVLFINPTEKKMIPCPYFLDDKCKFNEEECNFSHGYVISFDQLKEYV